MPPAWAPRGADSLASHGLSHQAPPQCWEIRGGTGRGLRVGLPPPPTGPLSGAHRQAASAGRGATWMDLLPVDCALEKGQSGKPCVTWIKQTAPPGVPLAWEP